ncbi:hypothetical protein O181_026890 [Austropuccinia psidii MF-1]|uniref:Uncharacterized protein n=1 Tax=Austropuccinia psidii MF-1 TaxID=1389203 RepID=A0A9Q3CQ99_9BASI|nr:hypothetical protein [Austropuccinia psidii MF-1]
MIIWLHVDDGVVFSKNKADLDNLKQSLCGKFAIKWDTTLSHIVGMNIVRDHKGFSAQPSTPHLFHCVLVLGQPFVGCRTTSIKTQPLEPDWEQPHCTPGQLSVMRRGTQICGYRYPTRH